MCLVWPCIHPLGRLLFYDNRCLNRFHRRFESVDGGLSAAVDKVMKASGIGVNGVGSHHKASRIETHSKPLQADRPPQYRHPTATCTPVSLPLPVARNRHSMKF